jgi:hypothetical protein
MTPNPDEIGVGATDELSLRVSVATLVRVLFKNPNDDELMLALERKATLRRTAEGGAVRVKSQPFGGAIRIFDLRTVHDLVDGFHFDSERSRAEQDFRIFIRPSSWSSLREFCLQHIVLDDDLILETSPSRELVEEFAETLSVDLRPEQYVSKPITTLVENRAISTENIYSLRTPTVRLYRIYEAAITDLFLPHAMLRHVNDLSHQRLCELAIADAQDGGKGKANSVLTLPWERLLSVYRAMVPAERNIPIVFEENRLDSTVAAILEEIAVPRYRNVY